MIKKVDFTDFSLAAELSKRQTKRLTKQAAAARRAAVASTAVSPDTTTPTMPSPPAAPSPTPDIKTVSAEIQKAPVEDNKDDADGRPLLPPNPSAKTVSATTVWAKTDGVPSLSSSSPVVVETVFTDSDAIEEFQTNADVCRILPPNPSAKTMSATADCVGHDR